MVVCTEYVFCVLQALGFPFAALANCVSSPVVLPAADSAVCLVITSRRRALHERCLLFAAIHRFLVLTQAPVAVALVRWVVKGMCKSMLCVGCVGCRVCTCLLDVFSSVCVCGKCTAGSVGRSHVS